MNTTARISGRHPVNIGHLVMGLALLGILGVWALVQSDTVTGDDVHWLLPIPWVVAGAVGLTVTAVTGSRRYAARQVGWVGPPVPEPVTEEPLEEPRLEEAGSDEADSEELGSEEPPGNDPVVEETAPITPQAGPRPEADDQPQHQPQTQTDPEEKP